MTTIEEIILDEAKDIIRRVGISLSLDIDNRNEWQNLTMIKQRAENIVRTLEENNVESTDDSSTVQRT